MCIKRFIFLLWTDWAWIARARAKTARQKRVLVRCSRLFQLVRGAKRPRDDGERQASLLSRLRRRLYCSATGCSVERLWWPYKTGNGERGQPGWRGGRDGGSSPIWFNITRLRSARQACEWRFVQWWWSVSGNGAQKQVEGTNALFIIYTWHHSIAF